MCVSVLAKTVTNLYAHKNVHLEMSGTIEPLRVGRSYSMHEATVPG